MAEHTFQVGPIDHVELFVPDQFEAAKWYKDVLGLEVVEKYKTWVDKGGPLPISSDNGNTILALFEGEPRGKRKTAGHHRVAFRASGEKFIAFMKRLEEITVYDDNGNAVESWDISDHKDAYSVYFCDPYGNRYEITCYDYDYVKKHLPEISL